MVFQHTPVLILLSLFLFLLISCNHHSHYSSLLAKAEGVLEEFPDSALQFLDSISSPHLLGAKEINYYHLLRVQAKDKTGRDITKDTVLFQVRDYYEKTDPAKEALTYLYLGKLHYYKGDYEGALLHYLEAEKKSHRLSVRQQGLIQHGLGNLFFTERSLKEAKSRYLKSLEAFVTINDLKNQIVCYNTLGNCFILEENNDSACYYYDRCVELLEDLGDDHLSITGILNNLSAGYRHMGEIEKARLYQERVFEYPLDNLKRAQVYYNLARLEKDDRFYEHMHHALELLEEDHMIYKSGIYHALSEYEESHLNFSSALNHHKKYAICLENFFTDKYENSLKDIEHTYYMNILERENFRLIIRHQRLFTVALVALLILICLAVWLYHQRCMAMIEVEESVHYLQHMSRLYNEKERSLRNIVLHNFNILKKVALLDKYIVAPMTNAKLLKRFHEIVYNQEEMDWDILYETMNKLNHDLFTKLEKEFPQLDESEFRICCLSIARFSNIEIGLLMNYSVNTINAKKANLRKKLGVKPMGNIEEFLMSYFGQKSESPWSEE